MNTKIIPYFCHRFSGCSSPCLLNHFCTYLLRQLKEVWHLRLALRRARMDSGLSEYHHCFVDSFSVEEWLQGLIELENLSSLFLLHSQMLVRETTDQQG